MAGESGPLPCFRKGIMLNNAVSAEAEMIHLNHMMYDMNYLYTNIERVWDTWTSISSDAKIVLLDSIMRDYGTLGATIESLMEIVQERREEFAEQEEKHV